MYNELDVVYNMLRVGLKEINQKNDNIINTTYQLLAVRYVEHEMASAEVVILHCCLDWTVVHEGSVSYRHLQTKSSHSCAFYKKTVKE